jgi:hypothetical protein
VVVSLPTHPIAESKPVFHVARWDASVTLTPGELAEQTKTLFPLVGKRVPAPAGEYFETTLTVGADFASGVLTSLFAYPVAQSEGVFHVSLRDAGVALAFNELAEEPETLIPLIRKQVPAPAGECFETALTVEGQPSFTLVAPLHAYPLAQSVPVFHGARWYLGMTLAFDKTLKQAQPELPTRGRLLNEVNIECAGEVSADARWEVEADFRWHLKALFPKPEFAPQLIKLFAQFVVVGTECFDHVPNWLERRSVEGDLWITPNLNKDGDDYGADLLVLRQSDGASHGLDDVNLGATWVDEGDSIESWHVNTFTKTSGVCEQPPFVVIEIS